MQTSLLEMPAVSTCTLDEPEFDGNFVPLNATTFSNMEELSVLLEEAEESFRQGKYRPADKALADIRMKYNL